MPSRVARAAGGMNVYTSPVPNFMFANQNLYNAVDTANRNAQIAMLNAQINRDMFSASMVNYASYPSANWSPDSYMPLQLMMNCAPASKPKEHYIIALDKALWPVNPIRDYIKEQIEKVEAKYEAIFKALDLASA